MIPTNLTGQQQQAAYLVAQGKLTRQEIADKLGMATVRTLRDWKNLRAFQVLVVEHKAEFYRVLREHGIADALHRLRRQGDTMERMQALIRTRAADKTMSAKAGGRTGLVVRDYKFDKEGGKHAVYTFDAGLVAAMNALEQHSQTDMGDWRVKVEHSGEVKAALSVEAISLKTVMSLAELEDLDARFAKAASAKAA